MVGLPSLFLCLVVVLVGFALLVVVCFCFYLFVFSFFVDFMSGFFVCLLKLYVGWVAGLLFYVS